MRKIADWSMHEYSFVDDKGNSLNNDQENSLNHKVVCCVKYSASSSSASSKKTQRFPRPSNPRRETSWPDYHFMPTDEELVVFYLSQKRLFPPTHLPVQFISVVDVYGTKEPWTLFNICDESQKYCFYVFSVVKGDQAQRVSRKAGSGHWVQQATIDIINSKETLIALDTTHSLLKMRGRRRRRAEGMRIMRMRERSMVSGTCTSTA
ncbi:hypothetical protein HS088_TW04G01095 [Tripterygium wilfordii]|uniref:NAC domain-containing protein n=1 Tax=Tripterygium wilfordii TaxID=458696 RepID=A0A7J7DRV2_TRIWF|nr:hypothetical protein HS088_TW04G01095 [Tripterygium wilfordii]